MVPSWLHSWCSRHLGAEPAVELFCSDGMSEVLGLRLTDGSEVVVKARPDDGRAAWCLAAQDLLAQRGFPCARPLTPLTTVDSRVVHAEEFLPGGDMLRGDSPEVAAACAPVLARITATLAGLPPAPSPNPRWVGWDHGGPGLWPAIPDLDVRDQRAVPAIVVDTAARVRSRLLAAALPSTAGHADFEAHNLRWRGRRIAVVHDWDSLAWQPEAALVGAASAVFGKLGPATSAPIASSAVFLSAYQDARNRAFTVEEQQVAWAASLWPVVHDLRWEALHGRDSSAVAMLHDQAAERLRRAAA